MAPCPAGPLLAACGERSNQRPQKALLISQWKRQLKSDCWRNRCRPTEQQRAQLAVDEINAAGVSMENNRSLWSKDDKSETAEAASVTTNLVAIKSSSYCRTCRTSGLQLLQLAASYQEAGVPLITKGATQDGLTKVKVTYLSEHSDSFKGRLTMAQTSWILEVVLLYFRATLVTMLKGIAKSFHESLGVVVAIRSRWYWLPAIPLKWKTRVWLS